MGQDVKFIIANSDESFGAGLRAELMKFDGVKVLAEIDEPALLGQAVEQFGVDVVLVNLDPAPEAVLPMLGEVIAAHPNLSVFASSKSAEGPLILKVMRLGCKEFLPQPIDVNALQEAIDRIARQRTEAPADGKLITIMGAAGGVGATMLATNLAVEFAAICGGSVTVADLDYRFGQLAVMLDVETKHTIADLCGSPEQLEPQVMSKALASHPSGVHVLGRPNNFAEADSITAASCVGVMTNLVKMNKYVVADGPTRFDLAAASLLAISDVNLLVVQLLVPCVRNAVRILDSLRQNGHNLERTKLVCNRVGRDSGHLSVDNIRETLGVDVFATIPDDWTTVSGAINLGEPLKEHGPNSKVRLAIRELAMQLHDPGGGADDKEKKKGLIGRIFASG